MKFMNNHYGQSRIFKHAHGVMADAGDKSGADSFTENDASGGGSGSDEGSDSVDEEEDESIDSLRAELIKARADVERFKSASDKNAKEAKKYKGQLNDATSKLNAKLTDAEREAKAKEERDAEFEEIQKELRTIKYSKRLIGIGMGESEADEMATVIPAMDDADAFFNALGKFVESVRKTSGEAAVQKLLKERPEINAGNGDSSKDDPAMAIAKRVAERNKSASGKDTNIINKYL